MFATPQELNNGLNNIALYYALIEQAQRQQAGRSIEAHQQAMAKLLASFSTIASNNPYAQFAGQQTAEEIQSASPINHIYTKRMIAQDSVNQGAAIILCSLGKAKALGIPESHYIYLHGMAEGIEHPLSQRLNPAQSSIANQVTDRALSMAKLTMDDIDLIDIYSCFPCAITAIAEHLGLPVDGSRALTLTGGLPYFGGPGNNYSMHAVAEAVQQLRQAEHKNTYAMVTANGGMLSKHAALIYSNLPSTIDWSTINTTVSHALPPVDINENPGTGTIVSYVIYPDHKGHVKAVIIGRTDQHEHFVAGTEDGATITAMQNEDPSGKTVKVNPVQGKLFFHLQIASVDNVHEENLQ
ncbi:hypothetical protein [Oceanicoccus sp. KOV_DT_Chl]|uniref:thiolase C-terminal domain-containing protein n=1 Tax=Oceanicoccus sp. KOV_DT_Chl TaxID=1904639 RepID=UPI000C7BC05C|nr:hypothetical protein [Oceanicoccus sp. KOV_DT_Chl]